MAFCLLTKGAGYGEAYLEAGGAGGDEEFQNAFVRRLVRFTDLRPPGCSRWGHVGVAYVRSEGRVISNPGMSLS